MGTRFSAVQTGPGAYPASCTMGTRVFPEGRGGRGVGLTPHPYLVPKALEKSTAIPLLTLRACLAYKKGENLPTRQNSQTNSLTPQYSYAVPRNIKTLALTIRFVTLVVFINNEIGAYVLVQHKFI